MNLISTIALVLSFVASSSNTNVYELSGNFTGTASTSTNVFYDTSNVAYYIDSQLLMTCDVAYDDASNYRLDNFYFEYQAQFYKLNTQNGGTPQLQHSFRVRHSFDWEITPSSYLQQFNNLKFGYWLSNGDDELRVFIEYENNFIEEDSYSLSNYTFSNDSDCQFSFSNDIIQQFESYLDNMYQDGFDDGYRNGYSDGSNDAWEDASQQDTTAVTIFSGILSIGLLPVNFFLAILNFEVFGINIGAFVSALLTIAIIVIVTRMVVNGGNGKD